MQYQVSVTSLCALLLMCSYIEAQTDSIETDILIVGGTESGCAAALQAARMGVKSITLVNDIEWLGGQFSAEALMAIDENRGPEGYGHGVPFPRSGIFREIMDEIESLNVEKYGVPRPGNTRVITTCLPSDAEKVFRKLLASYIADGTIRLISNFVPVEVLHDKVQSKVTGVRFEENLTGAEELVVEADLTIDASDWGDVIRLSNAEYEFGPDLKSKYNEPLAPTSREEYPLTDMNPITYTMVLKETNSDQTIPKPLRFDRRNYDGLPYPSDPSWIYASRRLVDRRHFPSITTPDAVLLCFPAFDYPLDVYSQQVVDELEALEIGASQKNIVEMTRKQRQVVFNDAKLRSLGFLYYLQTIAHKKATDTERTFKNLQLSDEFGTADRLPYKPYVRESLRLKSTYQLRQQDTMGFGNNANHYAISMYHDPIACWQFEYDFHPTKRHFLDDTPSGPWHPHFRKNRTWGPPYSGRAQFPLRSLVPEKINGLLGAQKNLGYSSIVSSAVRLHDQSVAIGQGVGAVAAVAIMMHSEPRELTWDSQSLASIWDGLLEAGTVPQTLWPFGDLDPIHPNFVAINQLAVRRLIPLEPQEVEFHPEEISTTEWESRIIAHVKSRGIETPEKLASHVAMTRGEFAQLLWDQIEQIADPPLHRASENDADGDGILDSEDPLPLTDGRSYWGEWSLPPTEDGIPAEGLLSNSNALRFNFGKKSLKPDYFKNDSGERFNQEAGFGWNQSLSANHRERGRVPEVVRDTFLFTRSHAVWELDLPVSDYHVTICCGDAGHEQFGQNLTLEGEPVLSNFTTLSGHFIEKTVQVSVTDGRLTVELGKPNSTTNTCLNWLIVEPVNQNK